MKNIRILQINDEECILFNAYEKRISGPCPAIVGEVAKRWEKGENLQTAMQSEGVKETLSAQVAGMIRYINGDAPPQKEQLQQDAPTFYKTLVLCPSSVCNLRCIYCSGCAGEKANALMDWTLAKDGIDYFFHHSSPQGPYTLQFHGAGEPLANFDIVKKSIDYARQITAGRGQMLLTRVSTNGVLTERQAEWVAEEFDHVSISLDGPPSIHNRQRPGVDGKGSYDTVVRTMRILEGKNTLKRLNTVITPYSIGHMDEILKHIRTLTTVKDIRLLPMSYCGRCESTGVPELQADQFEKELQENLPLARELGFNVLSVLEQADYYTQHYCGACGFNMCVAPNGNISTCIEVLDEHDPGAEELIIGHHDRGNRTMAIDWKKVLHLRQRTYKNLPGCTECSFRTNCSGSCLVRAARKNGTVMSVDPESCEMVKGTLSRHFIDMAKEGLHTTAQEDPQTPPALSFKEAMTLSLKVIRAFDEAEERPWTIETTMMELMKQVGDLSKRLMMYENYYFSHRAHNPNYRTSKDAIANELADIFHCIIRIADHYQIDLEEAHIKARQDEIGYIRSVTDSQLTRL